MFTDVTVNAPRPALSLALGEPDGLDVLGDAVLDDDGDDVDDPPPENRPMTVT